MSSLKHAELVSRAERWLRNTKGCGVVLTERHGAYESPDAIGWRGDWSILVECKVSLSDFYRDKKKPFRVTGGMGQERYFLTPPGLLRADQIPGEWGLIEAHARTVRVMALPSRGRDLDRTPRPDGILEYERCAAELPLLVGVMRCVQLGLEVESTFDCIASPAVGSPAPMSSSSSSEPSASPLAPPSSSGTSPG